jgi:hypothetical protein
LASPSLALMAWLLAVLPLVVVAVVSIEGMARRDCVDNDGGSQYAGVGRTRGR